MRLEHYSPSTLNLFAACPSMFVLEKVLKLRQPVGVPAHRGTAVEAGVAVGLFEPDRPVEDCVQIAMARYNALTALSGDPRRGKYAEDISAMVATALEELRPYGIPTHAQGKVEWQPEGLGSPIVGFYDFLWADKGVLVDLKTSEKLPSQIKIAHARQISLYSAVISDNLDSRASYITPRKRATYRLENVREHCNALHRMALACERFLAQSDDPQDFVAMTVPDLESFYWSAPSARQLAFEIWSI